MKRPVYLDNHATTPVDPRVVQVMLPYLTDHIGNAASTAHPYGWKAKEAVESARAQIANLARAEPGEVTFTSGATESINLVMKGIARNRPWSELHIVTWVSEHSAVLDTCTYLEGLGARIIRLPINNDGSIRLDEFKHAIGSGATLVTLMHANNEIGTVYPIDNVGEICQSNGIPFHVDAAQTFGKIPVNFSNGRIDFMSISGHKFYAPKGVGCLLIKRRNPPLRLTPLIHGGGHERGIRSGTVNVPGVVAMGEAAHICANEMEMEAQRITFLRNLLLSRLMSNTGNIVVNGSLEQRLPGNLNISISGVEGQLLLPALRNHISVSSGSACTSAHPRPSHVLSAIGCSDELSQASIRFGIGRFNDEQEIEFGADTLKNVVEKLRAEKM